MRTAIDRYRRHGRFATATAAEDLPAAEGAGISKTLDLDAAIRALPPGMRHLTVLHLVEGYRLHEVASMTGVAVGTVKSQIFTARRKLRAALGDIA